MPQTIYNEKSARTPIIDPLTGQDLNEIWFDDPSRYFNIHFDPQEMSKITGKSIYQPVFDGFQELYKESTGYDIDLTNGNRLVKSYDRTKQPKESANFRLYEKNAFSKSEESPSFNVRLGKSQKEEHVNRWAGETAGLIEYLSQNLPPDPSNPMHNEFYKKGGFIDQTFDAFINPMITHSATMLGDYHSQDSPGDYGKKMVGSAMKTFGAGIQANKGFLGKLAKLSEPLYDLVQSDVLEKTAEEYGKEVFETGRFIKDAGTAKYQEAAPATGMYAQTVDDRSWRAFNIFSASNLGFMAYKGTESLGSQVLTTGLGTAASVAVQLHPAVRGGTLLFRAAMGLAASTPALTAGYILESGDAYNSSIDELKKIRQEAIDVKLSVGKRAWTEKQHEYRLHTSENTFTTADLLTDKQIESIASDLAQIYGAQSTAVEAAGTALAAGFMVRQGAKQLGEVLGHSKAEEAMSRKLTRSLWKNVKSGTSSFLSTAATEAGTEGIQEYLQERLLEKEIPKYEINMSQVYDAAYAGGIFGGGISATQSAYRTYQGAREATTKIITEKERIAKKTAEIRKGKGIEEYDNYIIASALLGKSLEETVDFIASDDNSVEAREVEARIRGRYSKLVNEIDEIVDNPGRSAAFLKAHKEDLEFMDLELNERSLGYLMLQPEQIADILGVKVEELSGEEVIPQKYPKKTKKRMTVDEANLQQLEVEFGEKPIDDLNIVDEFDPTESIPQDPTENVLDPSLIEGMADQVDQIRLAQINQEIEELEDLSIDKHLSPLDRDIAIKELKEQKDILEEKSITTVSPAGKEINYKVLKVAELKEIALARNINIKETRDGKKRDLLRADLISILEESDLDKKPKTIVEAATNHAKNIIAETAESVIPNALPDFIVQEMPDNLLLNHAKNVVVDTAPFLEGDKLVDREGLIEAILQKQGPFESQMALGVPFFFKQKNKTILHQKFRQGYYELLKKVPDIGSSEGLFRRWVEELVGPLLPDHLRAEFYDWANSFAPNQTLANELAYTLYDKMRGKPNLSQAFESDIKDIEHIFIENADYTKELIVQQDTEGADIHTENFTHLNSGFFEAMGVVLSKDKIDEITLIAKNSLTFEDFVTAISSEEVGLRSDQGMTAVDIMAGDSPLQRRLNQFYVSNLVENNSVINDGKLGEGDFPDLTGSGKTVHISINRTKDGWQRIAYKTNKNRDGTKKSRTPGFARATMADGFIETPIIWLNGSDVTKSDRPVIGENGKQYWGRSPIYGFLTTEDIKELTATRFHEESLVPLFIKGDADRIGLIEVTDAQKALDVNKYWDEEIERYPLSQQKSIKALVHQYKGLELTEQEMIDLYGSVADYQASNIARHEAYKDMLGDNYHTLSAHKIMHRIKILYSIATKRSGFRESTIKLIDLNDSVNGDGKLFTRTTWKSGETSEKNLVIFANGKNQYAGEGMTITSERVFAEKYYNEVGANPLAKRAKTVKVVKTDSGTLLMKHQEMTFNLPEDAKKSEIFNGVEKVAEIRRESGQINIYVEDKDGNYTKYIDHLATTDEAKVFLGEFTDFSKVHSLPSEATGHVMFTEADKQKAPFPMQVTNYLNDPAFLKELNKLIVDPNNPGSAARLIDHMINISQNPAFFNGFLKSVKQKHPDSMPRMIIEMAAAGAGLHPSQLDYGSVLVKNRLFMEAMSLKQDGGVLDFRPNLVSNIEKGKIVLPYGHSIREVIVRRLSELKRVGMDFNKIMNLSREDLNALVKQNPVKIMLVRHPVPSRAGYRMLTVDSFETGIGDSFMINDEDVKEVFEGDYDHDTGHISILPDGMTYQLIKNQTFQDEMAALSLDPWADKVQDNSIGSLENTMEVIGEMAFGQAAIGEIANVQRVAGISQTRFGIDGYMEIEGKTVKVRKLTSMVTDPALGKEMSVEQLLRHYAQAAFDNIKLRLLKQWDYSQEKLYKMLFYNTDGSEITDVQYQILNKSIIKTLKKTQAIKNGQKAGKSLKLNELMVESEEYNSFVQDPANYLYSELKDQLIEMSDGTKKDAILLVGKIDIKDTLHPHEKLAIMPIEKLNNYWTGRKVRGLRIDEFFAINTLNSRNAHDVAYREISDDKIQLGYMMDALGVYTIEELQAQDKNKVLNEMQSGNEWGAFMRAGLNEVYQTIEEDDNTESSKIANSMTWDYNIDFVEFVDKWLDGYTRDDGSRQRGYNELTEVEKIAATYTFLGGIHDAEAGFNKRNVRKLPPISLRKGESLLHPSIMQDYFSRYNEIAADKTFDHERYAEAYNPLDDKFKNTIKEYLNCG